MINDYNQRLKNIEEYIFSILPEKADTSWSERATGASSSGFRHLFFDYISNINTPSLDLIRRGGKRWRPMLMLLLCEIRCGDDKKALPLTPLVELPHNGSLIIDDIEDNADFRRGRPAVHLIHGTDMAINSANFLYFLPSLVIDECSYPDSVKLLLYRYYSQAMRRLHVGQGLDIQWHRSHSFFPEESEYLQMCRFKTGSLSGFAAEAGITVAGGSAEEAAMLGKVCGDMGVGFQILDDVINLTSGNPGKKRGDDIVEGKKSLPVILFCRDGGDRAALAQCFENAGRLGIERGEEAIEKAVLLLENIGSIEKAERKGMEILAQARHFFEERFEKSLARDLVFFIIDSFTGSPR